MAEKKREPAPITLTLVVEYENTDALDVFECVRELIENSRSYGRPVSAKLTGIPSVLEVSV